MSSIPSFSPKIVSDAQRCPRVLMLIPELGYGGAESAFLRLANYLAQHANVTIALMSQDHREEFDYTDLPIEVLDRRSQARTPWTKLWRWLRMLWRTRQLQKKHDASISFLSGANLLNALAGGSRVAIVSERGSKWHDTGMSNRTRWIWTRLLDPLIYHRARWIVAASQDLAGEIVEHNPNVVDKTVAIEGTVLTEELLKIAQADVTPDFDAFADYTTVMAIGRLHFQKGFDFLLRAFADVRETLPQARLVIIGDGPEQERLQNLARHLLLRVGSDPDPDHYDVIFAGYRDRPVRFLQRAQLFVMPSRYEGLPNALIEALASGTPIMAADCPWGPRSVLAERSEELESEAVQVATLLAHGTLMPQIEQPTAKAAWVSEITAFLSAPALPCDIETCHQIIARFDINATGPRWMDLVETERR